MKKLLDKLIWICTIMLFSSFYIFATNTASRFILLGITIVIFGLMLVKNNGRFPLYWHSFHNMVFLFTLFCFLSYIWSIDQMNTLLQSSVILQIEICMFVLYVHYVNCKDTSPLVNVLIFGGYVVAVYAIFFYGIDNIRGVLASAKRLDNAFNNVNSISRLMAISSVAAIYQMIFNKFKWYHLFAVVNVFILAATGSKTGLILFMAGVSIMFFIRYSSKNWIFSVIRYFFITFVLFILLKIFVELPIFDGLNQRMTKFFDFLVEGGSTMRGSDATRYWMIRIGWQQFLENPLLGIGMGSSGELLAQTIGRRTYLHNNYIELLSGGGLVGTILYYGWLIVPGIQLFKQRVYHFTNNYFCLILIFLMLLMDVAGVSYASKNIYFYIMLIFIQARINKRMIKQMNEENVDEK